MFDYLTVRLLLRLFDCTSSVNAFRRVSELLFHVTQGMMSETSWNVVWQTARL